jgi:ATP-dependent exoDNAse (exonuclease V) alpha subunit
LIGAAGTGKTTTTREIIGQVVKLPQCLPIKQSTKYLSAGSPGVVIISFTNKAVNNIKRFLPDELKKHCITIHSLLEFKPVRSFDEMEIAERNVQGNFLPTYFLDNKLPHISVVIVEESSMVGSEDHWKWVLDALPKPNETQFIFLGDINQLPPIFGPSILGFKLLELPTVELTHVYRQALESPIITLAHKIREGRGVGKLVPKAEDGTGGFDDDRGTHGKVTIHPWKKKLDPVPACKTVQNFVTKLHQAGQYDPESDIILCPFNKTFGTVELNKGIADYFGKLRDAIVWEVCSRGMFSYWAVGDRVLVDRQEAIITDIQETPNYSGRMPDEPSKTMNRWGKDPKRVRHEREDDADKEILIAKGHSVLDTLEIGEDAEAGKNTASHTITVEFVDNGIKRVLSSSGDVNSMQFAYALTVHKSQGSEWRKVFLFLHYSHNTMLTRELMYTAVTRAKQELFIICEPDRGEIYNSLTRAAKSPEIKGVTLAEKAEYFKAKKKSMQRLADRQAQQKLPETEEAFEDMEE